MIDFLDDLSFCWPTIHNKQNHIVHDIELKFASAAMSTRNFTDPNISFYVSVSLPSPGITLVQSSR